jgi:hypothetical protein
MPQQLEDFHDGMTLEYGEVEDILDFQCFVRNHTVRTVEEGMDKKIHLSYLISGAS